MKTFLSKKSPRDLSQTRIRFKTQCLRDQTGQNIKNSIRPNMRQRYNLRRQRRQKLWQNLSRRQNSHLFLGHKTEWRPRRRNSLGPRSRNRRLNCEGKMWEEVQRVKTIMASFVSHLHMVVVGVKTIIVSHLHIVVGVKTMGLIFHRRPRRGVVTTSTLCRHLQQQLVGCVMWGMKNNALTTGQS